MGLIEGPEQRTEQRTRVERRANLRGSSLPAPHARSLNSAQERKLALYSPSRCPSLSDGGRCCEREGSRGSKGDLAHPPSFPPISFPPFVLSPFPFSPSSLLCLSPWLVATSSVPLRPLLRVRGCRLLSPPPPLRPSSRQAPRLPPPTSRGRRLSSPSFTSQCRLSLLFFACATVSLTVNLVVGAVTWTLLPPPRPRDDTFAFRPVDRPPLQSAGRTQEMPSSFPRWNNSRRRPFCSSTVTRTRRRSSDRCVGSDLLNCPSLSCPH